MTSTSLYILLIPIILNSANAFLTSGHWWLRSDGRFGIVGRPFSMTCMVPNGVSGVVWKRDGIVLGTVMTNNCEVSTDADRCYTYFCGSANYFSIRIPKMSDDDYNKTWECYNVLGENYGNSTHTPVLKAAVEYVTIHNCENENILHDARSETFTCMTGASRPAASIFWHYNGNTQVTTQAKTSTIYIGHDKYVTTSSITMIVTKEDTNKTLFCTAMNVNGEGRVQSNVIQINVKMKT